MEPNLGEFSDIVAFILPGMAVLFGFSSVSPTIQRWIGNAENREATIAGALLLLLTALGAGIVLDAVRVQTVDRIHHLTGVEAVEWDLSQFNADKLATFEKLIENYYVYSRFYGNVFIAVVIAYVIRLTHARRKVRLSLEDAGVAALLLVLWFGSRTDLQSFYAAVSELIK